MKTYDAILILGGGVRDGGVLPDYVAARFDRALATPGDHFFVPLSAGTTHRPPPLDSHGFPIHEARAGARYLTDRGIDPRRILIEDISLDTIGNAYFSRVIHAIPRGFRRALVITSAFHMPRTEALFRWIYSLDAPSCDLDFDATPELGIDPDALAARIAKERAALATLPALTARLHTLADFHAWLFTEHGAYAAGRRAPAVQADLGTY